MNSINFKTTLYTINSWLILRLPKEASAQLPSRGQVMVKGTINGHQFKFPLEPDGKGSHWFRIEDELSREAKIGDGDTVVVELEPTKDWPEPEVPADIKQALTEDDTARALWEKTTTLARWEWIRWIRSTNQSETRSKRIEVACSKMRAGEKRPCCWNRNLSTEPSVSKSGILLDLD